MDEQFIENTTIFKFELSVLEHRIEIKKKQIIHMHYLPVVFVETIRSPQDKTLCVNETSFQPRVSNAKSENSSVANYQPRELATLIKAHSYCTYSIPIVARALNKTSFFCRYKREHSIAFQLLIKEGEENSFLTLLFCITQFSRLKHWSKDLHLNSNVPLTFVFAACAY